MNQYKCSYSFQGQETEGHILTWETVIIPAPDKATACFYYLLIQGNNKWMSKRTLENHRTTEYAEGGWGINIEEL